MADSLGRLHGGEQRLQASVAVAGSLGRLHGGEPCTSIAVVPSTSLGRLHGGERSPDACRGAACSAVTNRIFEQAAARRL